MHSCRRHYPGGSAGSFAPLSRQLRPSPYFGWVGLRISLFGACSAFTRVTACVLAESPMRPFCTRGFGSFVTSATTPIATGWSDSCQVGFAPTEDSRLFTAHRSIWLACANRLDSSSLRCSECRGGATAAARYRRARHAASKARKSCDGRPSSPEPLSPGGAGPPPRPGSAGTRRGTSRSVHPGHARGAGPGGGPVAGRRRVRRRAAAAGKRNPARRPAAC